MKRRNFIKYSAGSLLTLPLVLGRYSHLYAYKYASPIVSVFDGEASRIQYREGKVINHDGVIVDKILSSEVNNIRIARMVDTAIMKFTGKSTVGEAWESLFPAGHPNSNTKIGVKLNFSYGDWRNDNENDWAKSYCPFGAKAAVTNAMVLGLSQMMDGTFPIENITLIERMYLSGTRRFYPVIQGYRPVNPDSDGLYKDSPAGAYASHWIYQTNPLELPPEAPEFIAAPDYTGEYQAPQRIYAAIYNNDFMINYAIAKDHRAAGITGAMKNNYGCIDNPFGTHGNDWNKDETPYAGTRLCIPVIHKNVDLHSPYLIHIMDALTGIYNGGPLSGKVFQANTIAVSKDPVAMDSFQLNMINKARQERGLSLLEIKDGRTTDRHPNASFLRIAAENHELGSLAQDNLQTYDVTSEAPEYEIPAMEKSKSLVSEVKTSNGICKMHVLLDNSNRSHIIESRIEDIRGKVIRSFKTQSTRSSLATLEWDFKNDDKQTANQGVYIWYARVDGTLHTGTINSIF